MCLAILPCRYPRVQRTLADPGENGLAKRQPLHAEILGVIRTISFGDQR